jgi:predicted nucleic acid-binding protein
LRVLLDTCLLSELRRPKGHPGVRRVVEAPESDSLFVSVVSIGEIAKAIALLKESKNKRELQAWLQALERYYAGSPSRRSRNRPHLGRTHSRRAESRRPFPITGESGTGWIGKWPVCFPQACLADLEFTHLRYS